MSETYNIVDSVINVFPSSNATKKTTSEENLRAVITRLKIGNYVVDESTGLAINTVGTLSIPSGYAVNINGYLISFENSTSVSNVPSDCDVFMKLCYNGDGLLYGKEDDVTYTHGIVIVFTEPLVTEDYVQITKVVNDAIDPTFIPNKFPISTKDIKNGDTNDSLADYISTTAPNTYVSKVDPDTKKGDLDFIADGNQDHIDISNTGIDFKNSSTVNLHIAQGIISKDTSKIEFKTESGAKNIVATANNFKVIGNASITASGNVVTVDNTGTTLGNFKINGNNITNNNAITVTNSGGITFSGNLIANKVYNAVFNDYAEAFEVADIEEGITTGDVVAFTEDGTVTKVTDGADVYRLCGIVSSEDTYAYCLGATPDELANGSKVPVALCGRVYLNCESLIDVKVLTSGTYIAVKPNGQGLEIVRDLSRRVIGKVTKTVEINEENHMVQVKVVSV